MNFDAAKENIQPLMAGRNAEMLRNALTHSEDLVAQRQTFEDEIEKNTNAEDPLDYWYKYLIWIEQSYPTEHKRDSGFMEVLTKCLFKFENEPRYRQDPRFIKLIIKLVNCSILASTE